MEDLKLSLGEGVCERKVTLSFLVILCWSAFCGICGRSFLERIYAVASPVHMKMWYYNREGELIVFNADLDEVRRNKEVILKDLLASSKVTEGGLVK